MPFSTRYLKELLLIVIALVLFYLIEIVVSKVLFHGVQDGATKRVLEFASIYSNAGFMGIPLVQALFGSKGVFFASISLAIYNIFNWTHGIGLFEKQASRRDTLRQLIKNPNLWAVIVGLGIFIGNVDLPHPVNQFLTDISNLNTPLAMFVVGASLVQVRISKQTLNGHLWLSLALRNLIFPVVMIVLLKVLGVTGTGALATILMAACPTASLVVLFSVQYKSDTNQAIPLFGISTLGCLVTLPLIYALI
ncbi:transporter [Secundilactobacillus paracollinoides]|nr:AEC family transporter [Secundilactobacillus paracollinoides]ANZ62901.1 transporter [Secundilactobacillus paracollinoides]